MEPDRASTIHSIGKATRFDRAAPVVETVSKHLATTVFVVCLEPDQELPPHPAPGALTLLVIEGHPTISVEGVQHSCRVGDVLVMSTGSLHSLVAGSDRAVVVGVSNREPDPVADLSPAEFLADIEVALRPDP